MRRQAARRGSTPGLLLPAGATWAQIRAAWDPAGPNAALGEAFVAIYDRAFLIGPGFFAGVANGMILGYLMYRSGLVPRGMAILGLIGGPLVAASGIAVMFDVIKRESPVQGMATIPEFFWELSFGIYLIVKGFKPSPILAGVDSAPVARGAGS